MLAGQLAVDRIVPEEFEDLSCEGTAKWQIQVKSRQERVGDFTVGNVVTFLLHMFEAHKKRKGSLTPDEQHLVLVLERPVAGHLPAEWGRTIDKLPETDLLRQSLLAEMRGREIDEADIRSVCSLVSVYVLPWRQAADELSRAISDRYQLPASAATPVVRALRDEVAECVDTNAAAAWSVRAGMDRTKIEEVVTGAVALIDLDALEEALTSGACEPVNFDHALTGSGFFEGLNVQPGHITAGLPAPRPLLTGDVVNAIEQGTPALVTGPSGVGKSTVMWAAAYATRHVLWYRVRRLNEADVEPLTRLVLAAHPSARSPVGLVVDAVGQGAAQAWDSLQRRLAGRPGTVLLGSVRSEDLMSLETLPSCTTVAVTLDEEVAAEIHKGLLDDGRTDVVHWRGAYEQAQGLTLEYTYLLTRGRRLADVVAEQVRSRVRLGREAELRILALASTAHRWGTTLDMRRVQHSLELSDSDYRIALTRLTDEHLLHTVAGRLGGLHQLRSTALSDAVHAQPPPALSETIGTVLSLLDGQDILPFIVGAAVAVPGLDEMVLDHLATRLSAGAPVDVWTNSLQALRLVDFRRRAGRWAAVMHDHGVVPSLRRVAIVHALADLNPLTGTRPEIVSAVHDIRLDNDDTSPLRDALLERLGATAVAQVLDTCADCDQAERFLGVLGKPSFAAESEFVTAVTVHGTPLSTLLKAIPADELSEVLVEARLVSAALARRLMDIAGGFDSIRDRLFEFVPDLLDVSVETVEGVTEARAELLVIFGSSAPEVEKTVLDVAKVVLRCIPYCDQAEVRAVQAGQQPFTGLADSMATKRLSVKGDVSAATGAWNRQRAQIVAASAGTADPTSRAQAARELIIDLKRYLDQVVLMWCAGSVDGVDRTAFALLHQDLERRSNSLTIPVEISSLLSSAADPNKYMAVDSVDSLITGVVSNLVGRLAAGHPTWASVAMHVGDNLSRHLQGVVQDEQWYLTGQDVPEEAGQIGRILGDLHVVLAEVAWGGWTRDTVRSLVRRRPTVTPLAIAAKFALLDARKRVEAARKACNLFLRHHGLRGATVTREIAVTRRTSWPSVRSMIYVDIVDLAEWSKAHVVIGESLRDKIDMQTLGGSVLIMPRFAGKAFISTAHTLATTMEPANEEAIAPWRDELDPWPTPLTDATETASRSLITLSCLGELAARRHRTDDRIASQVTRFEQAYVAIAELAAEDRLVDGIKEILAVMAQRVEDEINAVNEQPTSVTFAAELAAAATPAVQLVRGVKAMAVQWDMSGRR